MTGPLAALVDRFAGLPVAVVGDLVADVYVHGVPERVSREAPVLVLAYEREELIPGGAANTAANLVALGAEVHPVGVVGDDEHGRALLARFEEWGVSTDGIVLDPDYRTITKTRVLAGGPTRWKTQVVRIDRDPGGAPGSAAERAMLRKVRDLAPRMRGFVFSDYGYGAASPGVAGMLDGVRVADSRFRIEGFTGFTCLTPNEEEAGRFTGRPALGDAQVRAAGKALLAKTGAENVLVTRGNKGMALFSAGGGELFLAASGAGEVTDVTGGGDPVTGVVTLALAAGAEPGDAARLANHAAGIVVTKAGAATVSPGELAARIREAGEGEGR